MISCIIFLVITSSAYQRWSWLVHQSNRAKSMVDSFGCIDSCSSLYDPHLHGPTNNWRYSQPQRAQTTGKTTFFKSYSNKSWSFSDFRTSAIQKGCGYHLDLLMVGVMLAVCSIMGLPWFVAATVLSISHVNSLKLESESSAPGEQPRFLGIREQRLTGLVIFLLMGLSVFMTRALKVSHRSYIMVAPSGVLHMNQMCNIPTMTSKEISAVKIYIILIMEVNG